MDNVLELLNNLYIECSDFKGTLSGFSSAERLAKHFEVSQISFKAFFNGKLTYENDVLTLGSIDKCTHIDFIKESPSKERSLVLRMHCKNSPETFSQNDQYIFNIFSGHLLNTISTYCLYIARKENYMHDDTGLTNKTYYLESIEKLIDMNIQSEYFYGHLNIKNATKLNSIFGNSITDKIIIQYGIELSKLCQSDLNENVSRLGGDNFAFVVQETNIDKFIESIRNVPISFQNDEDSIDYVVKCRAGVIQGTSNNYNAGEILSNATSVYKLTRKGNKDILIGDASNTASHYDSPTFLNELIFDLKSEKLLVYYQPIIKSNGTNEMIAAEALVRWRRSGELIKPSKFLPLAEKMGFITDIDLFVLKKGCETLSKWISEGKKVVPISFNFSHHDFSTVDISNSIIEIVDCYNIDRNLIIIELKEADYLEEHEILLHATKKLREAGIRVAIDSFGSGYASISLLKQFDFNYLKLDSSLVNDTSDKANTIIRNMVNLAHELSILVVCKGINNKERIEKFKENGNHYFQSEYFEKPLSERFFSNRLN